MKKFAILGITLLVLFAVAGTTLAAGFGGMGNGTGQSNGTSQSNGAGQPMLDVSSPVAFSGTVTDLSHYAVGEGPSQGNADSYVLFRTTSGEEIHLVFGPSWYLDQAGLGLTVGNALTGTGYRELDGDLVVASLVKDGQTLALRDDTGYPLWTGSRGQGMGRLGNGSGTTVSGMDRPFNGNTDGTPQSPQAGAGLGMGRRGNNNGQALCDGTCANCTAP